MKKSLEYNLKGESILMSLLKNERFRIEKGKIRCSSPDEYREKIIAADTYFGITEVLYQESNRTETILYVQFQSAENKIDEWFTASVNSSGTVRFDFDKIAKKLTKEIQKEYVSQLLKVYKSYIKLCIQAALKQDSGLVRQCGWFNDEGSRTFKAINYRNDDNPKSYQLQIESLIFNGMLKGTMLTDTTIEKYCQKTDNMKELFSLLLSDGNALMIFSYCIHSILWDYIYNYQKFKNDRIPNPDTVYFSLCIHGEKPIQAKKTANLLVNLFDIPMDNWASISRKIHKSASSAIDSRIFSLESCASVPVIFTCAKNNFYKSSSIIKTIYQQREKGRFHFFPVYISKTPVLIDEMVNCCVDNLPLDFNDTEKLSQIHRELCFLLYHFICYLTEISNYQTCPDRSAYYYFENSLSDLFDNLKASNKPDNFYQWLDYRLPELLLFASLNCFCYYISNTPLSEYSEPLLNLFVTHFNRKDIPAPKEVSFSETSYLQSFSEFLETSVKQKKNDSWIFEGRESRGEQEQCFYLSAENGYRHFSDFLKKKHLPNLSKSKLLKLLKDSGILKLPNTGNSNSFCRHNIYVYVIKKDSLSQFKGTI